MSQQGRRNILLLGTGNTTSFINNCEAYSKSFEFQGQNFSRTTVIAERRFTLFDEQLCFIDTPKCCQLQNLYKVLRNCNGLDAILVFADCSLNKFKLDMQTFFTASNYPRDKIIFVVPSYCRELNMEIPINSLRTMVNLQNNLMELDMTTTMVLGKNLFVVDVDFFRSNEMSSFRYSLKNLFSLQPCVFRYISDTNLLKTITDVYSALIEVLQTFSDERKMSLQFLSVEDQYNICKNCPSNAETSDYDEGYGSPRHTCAVTRLHRDKKQKVQAKNCSQFKSGTCKSCTCSAEDHISLRYKLSTAPHLTAEYELEKATLQHILATLHLFCKRSGLNEVCNVLKNGYWSLVRRKTVSSEDPVFQEIDQKIRELEPHSHHHTPEEIGVLLQNLRNENWCSFNMKAYFEDNSELKLISNTNLSVPETMEQISNKQKTLRFSEVNSKFSQSSGGCATKEDERDVMVEILRKELDEVKMEKESMQNHIDVLKQKIEDLQKPSH